MHVCDSVKCFGNVTEENVGLLNINMNKRADDVILMSMICKIIHIESCTK